MTASNFAFWTELLCLPDYEVVYCQKEGDLPQYRMTVAPHTSVWHLFKDITGR
jgi:hypothetical protein